MAHIPTGVLSACVVGVLALAGTWLTVRQTNKQSKASTEIDEFSEITGGYQRLLADVRSELTAVRERVDRLEETLADRTQQLEQLKRDVRSKDEQIRQWARWAAQVVALLRDHGITPPPLPRAFREDG